MEKVAVFSVREDQGVWLACVSQTYPVSKPTRQNFSDFDSAYDWASSGMPSGILMRGALHGMYYIVK